MKRVHHAHGVPFPSLLLPLDALSTLVPWAEAASDDERTPQGRRIE